jgi:hypothetical protein
MTVPSPRNYSCHCRLPDGRSQSIFKFLFGVASTAIGLRFAYPTHGIPQGLKLDLCSPIEMMRKIQPEIRAIVQKKHPTSA